MAVYLDAEPLGPTTYDYSDHSWELITAAEQTAETLQALRFEPLDEDQVLSIASHALTTLVAIDKRGFQLHNSAMGISNALRPEEDLAAFLAWDGQEPREHHVVSVTKKTAEAEQRNLSTAFMTFILTKHIEFDAPQYTNETELDDRVRALFIAALEARSAHTESPLGPGYNELFDEALTVLPASKKTLDMTAELLRARQAERRKFDPDVMAKRQEKIEQAATELNAEAEGLWADLRGEPSQAVRSWLAEQIVALPTENTSVEAEQVLYDVARLVPLVHELYTRRYIYDHNMLNAKIAAERSLLERIHSIATEADEFEDKGPVTSMVLAFQPRHLKAVQWMTQYPQETCQAMEHLGEKAPSPYALGYWLVNDVLGRPGQNPYDGSYRESITEESDPS